MRFELRQLESFDDQSLIDELRRVASLIPEGPVTREAFDSLAKASSHTVIRRFGGWSAALRAANLEARYSGRRITTRMRSRGVRGAPNEELFSEIRRVASLAPASEGLTREFFDRNARFHSAALHRRFGSWTRALASAGLNVVPHGRRHRDDDYFENLLTVWTHHGRQPYHREMNLPPSRISAGAYEKKYGTWKRALRAFVEMINESGGDETSGSRVPQPSVVEQVQPTPRVTRINADKLSLGLRYSILRRDRFRCALCGRSPSTVLGLELHVDHIVHRSRGGTNDELNLRTLCNQCNVGRGTQFDEPNDSSANRGPATS